MATTPYLPNGMVIRGDQTSPLTQTEVDLNWLSLRGGGMIYVTRDIDLNLLTTPGRYYWVNGVPNGNGFPSGLATFGIITVDTTPSDPNQGTVTTYQRIESYALRAGAPTVVYARRIVSGTPTGWQAKIVVEAFNAAPTSNMGPVTVINSDGEFSMIWESAIGRYVKVYDGKFTKEFTSSSSEQGSWTTSTYFYHFLVEVMIGGGGGGGAGYSTASGQTGCGGGGGGSGNLYLPQRFTHDFVQGPLLYTIGAGGLGAKQDGSAAATAGGNTTLLGTMTATGGIVGTNGSSSFEYGGPGGGNGSGPGSLHHGGFGGPGVLGYVTKGGVLRGNSPQNGDNASLLNYGSGGGGGSGKTVNTAFAGNGGNGSPGFIRLRY